MFLGVIGQKVGMTRLFMEDGLSVPVTIIEVTPNRITQIKTEQTDKYNAIQVTAGNKKISRVNKPLKGHFAKAGVEPGCSLHEFRIPDSEKDSEFTLGSEYGVEIFQEGQTIDVSGTSKGKGYASHVKRHHFRTQDATHGNSVSHRAPGSIGQNQTPGRVFKGKKMSGRLGHVKRTIQNLTIVKIDLEKNLLIVKGSIPGAPGGEVIVRPAVKE